MTPLHALALPYIPPDAPTLRNVVRIIGDCATCGTTVDTNHPTRALDETHGGCQSAPDVKDRDRDLRAAEVRIEDTAELIADLERQLAMAKRQAEMARHAHGMAQHARASCIELEPGTIKIVGIDDVDGRHVTLGRPLVRTSG